MTPELEAEIKAFVKERDTMLLACDIDQMLSFHAKHNPNAPEFRDRDTVEAAIHKARTGALSLPIEARLESKRWLNQRGMSSLDSGDLSDV